MIAVKKIDSVVIGAGAAGMAAAEVIAQAGCSVALVDREEQTGGILLQCIHNGFGLHHFGRELTGPEYADEFSERVRAFPVEIFLETTVVNIVPHPGFSRVITCSALHGVTVFEATTIVLAMGCRERNRGTIGIPGTRPSGVFTAGLAQRLLNIEGYIPGRRAVIIGSGDIGLIMARRLTWVGSEVAAVVEILPHPSGLTRNIVQCLQDFSIPLLLSHAVTQIYGKDRVEGVEVAPLENGVPVAEKARIVACDTVLLSVGLIPENELSCTAGVTISPNTGGPVVDHRLQTSAAGIFACGNVLHVHDLVDFVTEEAQRCGGHVVDYLRNKIPAAASVAVEAGANIKYVTPNQCAAGTAQHFYLRPLVIREKAKLAVMQGQTPVFSRNLSHVRPAEMISIDLDNKIMGGLELDRPLTFSIR
ncbi:MAG: FAD-dependent oxidoreductase [Chitinispirillaceae bacterium]|nr:FAD-dependent oxidoreductase [Chitinispirillaceae bacterium]